MALYFETKVKFDKIMENGSVKKVNEPYIVDALSFTEAEARIMEEVKAFISGEVAVVSVKKTNIAEIFRNDSGDWWYKVKANFISVDNKGCEKKMASYFLVQALDFRNALENFLDGMKGTMADFEIASISETQILDVFDYKE